VRVENINDLMTVIKDFLRPSFFRQRIWMSVSWRSRVDHYSWLATSHLLRCNERVNHSIEVVEERDEIECQFYPAFALAFVENVGVHDGGWIVQSRSGHDWSLQVAVDVVSDERQVQEQREELSGHQEQEVEEDVHHILGQHQRVQAVALVDRVLVVRLKLVERDYVENGEKDEESVEDESHDVAERCKCEGHCDHVPVRRSSRLQMPILETDFYP